MKKGCVIPGRLHDLMRQLCEILSPQDRENLIAQAHADAAVKKLGKAAGK